MQRLTKFFDKSLFSIGDGKMKLSVFSLALPIFFENVCVQIISFIQSSLSSRYMDGFFVTPLNVAANTVGLISNVAAVIATGMSIVLSICIGQKRTEDCKKIVGTSIVSLLALRLALFTAAFFLAEPLMELQGLGDPDNVAMLAPSVVYFRGQCAIAVVTSLTSSFATALRCYGHTNVGFFSSVSAGLVTLVMTWWTLNHSGVEFQKVMPAFITISVCANAVALLINFVCVIACKIPVGSFDLGWLKRILKVGFPATISSIMYSVSVAVTGAICIKISNDTFLVKTYVSTIVYFSYAFGYAIGQANAIMVGRGCGMKQLDKVDAMHRQNLRLTLACNLVLSTLCALFGKPLLGIFTDEQRIIALGAAVFWIDVAVEMGRGMNHLGQFGLNATGDTVYTTVVSVVSATTCSITLGYLLSTVLKLGVYGIWIAAAADELFRGTLYYVRWRKEKWRKSVERETKVLKQN